MPRVLEEGGVLWTSGPSWHEVGNGAPGEAAPLQQYWASSSCRISAQALLLGFSRHERSVNARNGALSAQ